MNAFVIVRETEEEALAQLRAIVSNAHTEAVEGFRKEVSFRPLLVTDVT